VVPGVTNEGDVIRHLESTIAAFLAHPFTLNEAEYRMALKVGVALYPEDGTDADTLFKNAEAAGRRQLLLPPATIILAALKPSSLVHHRAV